MMTPVAGIFRQEDRTCLRMGARRDDGERCAQFVAQCAQLAADAVRARLHPDDGARAGAEPAPAPAPVPSLTKLPTPEPALASLATLKDIEQQRNPKRVVEVQVSKPSLKIGKDSLDLSIKSSHDGYLYLILLGSDSKSFYVLYPNGLDKNNQVKAGQTVRIPRPDWEVKAAGPVGTNNLLVMVSDSPRKLNTLTMSEPTAAEPFTYALNDIGGRSALINFLTSSGTDGKSESFGAKLVAVKEVK